MKKFLLSLAVAALATSAFAEKELALPTVWGGELPADGAYDFNGSWAGAGTYLIGEGDVMFDASAYDYAMLTYSNHQGGKFAFKVIYNKFVKQESWGAVYQDGTVMIEDEKGNAFIKLDKASLADGGKTFAEEIREFQIQDQGAATTFTLEKLVLLTEEEYKALQGEAPTPEQPAGEEVEVELTEGHTLLISTLEAAGATDEATVTFYIQNDKGESREGWGIGGFAESDNWDPVEKWTGMAGDAWTYTYTVADIKKIAAAGEYHDTGITINIYNDCKVIKVTVTAAATGIANVEVASEEAAFNLFGQQSNGKGFTVKGGKIYLVK